jgi:hypothetical protein
MSGQVNHHYLYWNEMAEDHIRTFTDTEDDRFSRPHALHRIIHHQSQNGARGVEHRYVVEFQAPLESGKYSLGRAAESFAKWVFPNLHFPRWHRPGGSMTIVRHPGTARWLAESLNTPLLGIKTNKLLYLTTDDPDDFVLMKMRFDEYRGE